MTYRMMQAMVLVAGLAAGACSRGADGKAVSQAAAETTAKPNMLEVDAGDFYFHTKQSVPAGLTTIRLKDEGKELHHVTLVRIGDGHTVEDVVAWLQSQQPMPAWASLVGGPNAPVPGGGMSEVTVSLTPGEYAMICVIPSADGVPHVMKGMMLPLTVTASTGPTAAPTADVTMALSDYAFEVTPALTSGHHVVRVENKAAQPHEVFIARLAPGKTAEDLVSWVANQQGPPPGEPKGGATAMSPGEVNYLSLDLEPGEYGLFCFMPDAKDGKEHTVHGMVRQITVE